MIVPLEICIVSIVLFWLLQDPTEQLAYVCQYLQSILDVAPDLDIRELHVQTEETNDLIPFLDLDHAKCFFPSANM